MRHAVRRWRAMVVEVPVGTVQASKRNSGGWLRIYLVAIVLNALDSQRFGRSGRTI
jgi:hypothetical protein